jgi:hypothetical protein
MYCFFSQFYFLFFVGKHQNGLKMVLDTETCSRWILEPKISVMKENLNKYIFNCDCWWAKDVTGTGRSTVPAFTWREWQFKNVRIAGYRSGIQTRYFSNKMQSTNHSTTTSGSNHRLYMGVLLKDVVFWLYHRVAFGCIPTFWRNILPPSSELMFLKTLTTRRNDPEGRYLLS